MMLAKLNIISQVDENMRIAQRRDAVRLESFFFRKNVFSSGRPSRSPSVASDPSSVESLLDGNCKKGRKLLNCYPPPEPPEEGLAAGPVEQEYEKMTIEEIMLGKARVLSKIFWRPLLINSYRMIHFLAY